MRTIVLNRSNLIDDGQNNKLVYHFPGSVKFEESYVAVAQINMYYSWHNISAALGNNTLHYWWCEGGNAGDVITGTDFDLVFTEFEIVIPDGLYEFVDLNEYIQFKMIENEHYIEDLATGSNKYFFELIPNQARYAMQVNTFPVPYDDGAVGGTGSLKALYPGYTYPVGVSWTIPAGTTDVNNFNPSVIQDEKFNLLTGYPAPQNTPTSVQPLQPQGFYNPTDTMIGMPATIALPAGATSDDVRLDVATGTVSYIGPNSPDIQPNSSLMVSLSNIDNSYAQPTSILYSIVPTVVIGGLIAEKPPTFAWNKLINGTYNQLRLTLLGTDLDTIIIKDPNMTFILVIKDRNEV